MLIEIERPVANAAVERLIPADAPTRPRAVAVIDGVLRGRAWTDDPGAPTAVLVLEDADGTVYGGGALTPTAVREALADVVTASGDLIFGFAGPSDPLREMVPAEPYWSGHAVDFTDRVPPADEEDLLSSPLPGGTELRPLDATTLPLTEWYEDTLHALGSVEAWERNSLGYGLFLDGALVAECTAGPRTRGLLEMGVVTREAHRRRGFGTLVSAAVASAAEARGDRVWWNANAANTPSLAIARRLGFTVERRYELVACHAPIGVAGAGR